MKSKKDTSPVRSRDNVLQSLYEIELGGATAEEILRRLTELKSKVKDNAAKNDAEKESEVVVVQQNELPIKKKQAA